MNPPEGASDDVPLDLSDWTGPAIDVDPERTGWHMVRPGDTLERITREYLLRPFQWLQNWEINPELGNPNRIYPGDRLQVYLPGDLPGRATLITRMSRDVEGRRRPFNDWTKILEKDLLLPQDGLRTRESSSAELLFGDATTLVVAESSMVFLGGRNEPETKRDTRRERIEVVEGQADVEARYGPEDAGRELEVVLGDTTTLARADEEGKLATRARQLSGAAQVMVYQGWNDVESGGSRVRVDAGEGTSIAAGRAPGQPERLPDAPQTLDPPPGSQWNVSNPPFRWRSVAGASTYVLEVCRDPRCGAIVERVLNLRQPEYRPERRLPIAEMYWRVTGVTRSGLDGYPSEPVDFEVLSSVVDLEPPRAAVRLVGQRTRIRERIVAGPEVRFDVRTVDPGVGSIPWTAIFDGQEVDGETWGRPWSAGEHTVEVVATDRAGNTVRSEPIRFLYDPDPPRLTWGLEEGPTLGEVRGLSEMHTSREASSAAIETQLIWSSTGERWHQLRTRPQRVVEANPRVVLRPAEGSLELAPEIVLGAERGLWVEVEDEVEGSVTLRFGVEDGRLRVEARDAVGNESRVEWP